MHQAASTRPVRGRWIGYVECSVSGLYGGHRNCHTAILFRAKIARPYQNSLTDVTRDKDNTHPETLTNKAKSKSQEAGKMRKFITRRQSNHPRWSAAVKEIARGPAAERSGETTRACGAPTERIERRGAPAAASDEAGRTGWTGGMVRMPPAHRGRQES